MDGLQNRLRMAYRALLVGLTSITTLGLGAPAIAQQTPQNVTQFLLAQATSPQASAATQALQQRLTELGYYQGPVDGLYSEATRDALAAFQKDAGLVGTGILDPLTEQRLSNPAEAAPPPAPGTETPTDSSPAGSGQPAPAPPPAATATPAPAPTPDSPPTGEQTETTPPDAATSDEAAPSATPTPATEAAPSENAAPASERNLARIALLGLALLGLGGMGTAALLLVTRRRTASQQESDSMPGEPQGDEVSRVAPTAATPKVPQNGNQATTSLTKSSVDVGYHTVSVHPTSEPRVARVNIIDELIQDLANPDPTIRRKSIWELGQRGNSAAVQPLAGLLVDADSHEQSLILAALAEISMKTLKPINRAIAIALQDENPEVRKNAIRDLTRVYDSLGQVGRLLGSATGDSDPEVRQTAKWALNQLSQLRLSATESAPPLQEGHHAPERLPEDGSSSRKL